MSRETFTRQDWDNLADIIWWVKGYHAGAVANLNPCPFNEEHVESIRKARVILTPPEVQP
jgi:hypothetical protein